MRIKSHLSGSRDAKATLAAIVIVAILITSTVGAFLFVTIGSGSDDKTVKTGSKISVNYTGKLTDGRVFDTSLYSVATDNGTYPKSFFFTARGNATVYKPLDFTVGSSSTITGFNTGVLGMKIGETKTFTVTPANGYKSMDPAKLYTRQINETVPVLETMTAAAFKALYKQDASAHLTVNDPIYGWEVQVQSVVDSNNVLVKNLASNGSTYHIYASSTIPAYGWTAQVTSMDSYNIVLHHNLDASSIRKVGGLDESSVKTLVVEVDLAAGTYKLYKDNAGTELKGVDIVFTVTVLSIA